jgi:serine/threonine protein kinase/formylglycine-generating enzyme required for sulfatase activity
MTSGPDFIGKYLVVRSLGLGGMGSVYLARDPDLQTDVAIKVMREGFDTPESRQRFIREARAIAQLQRHPNIVKVHHYGETEEKQPYIVMEYINGETLDHVIRSEASLRDEEKLALLEQLCAGLAYAHTREPRVIHRDIKPANLIVDSHDVNQKTLKIVDFGIARQGAPTLTATSHGFMGTVPYMAPEQVLGENVDFRCDEYSAGLVAYELLSYRNAFPRNDKGWTDLFRRRMTNEQPRPLKEVAPYLDARIVAVVNRMLQPDREQRYGDLSMAARDFKTVRESLEDRRRIVVSDVATTAPFDPNKTIKLDPAPKPSPLASTEPRGGSSPAESLDPVPSAFTRWLPWAAVALLVLAVIGTLVWFGQAPADDSEFEAARKQAQDGKQAALKEGATGALSMFVQAEAADKEAEDLAKQHDRTAIAKFQEATALYGKATKQANLEALIVPALRRVEDARQKAQSSGNADSAHLKNAASFEAQATTARANLDEQAVTLYYQAANEYEQAAPDRVELQPPTAPTATAAAHGEILDRLQGLTWDATGARTYDVYFGTTASPPRVSKNQAIPFFNPSALSPGTQYFWKIVARNSIGATPGPVWSFSMRAESPGEKPTKPGIAAPITPADRTTVDAVSSLAWSATNATTYDVYFGTTPSPPQVAPNLAATSFKPASLEPGTQYYWRIDSRNSAGTTPGKVWSFSVRALPPQGPAPFAEWVSPKDELRMVYVPPPQGGTFAMGSPANEEGRASDEDQSDVALSHGFWLDQTEVTRQAFKRFVDARGGSAGQADLSGDPLLPVAKVDWQAARTFCEWTGGRLPTEAEWEYAARGTSKRRYWWGNDEFIAANANAGSSLLPVDGSRKNPFKLTDMLGNVWEWTSTLYRRYPYSATDGREDPSAGGPRVARGGAYHQNEKFLRIASRIRVDPDGVSDQGGFRCAR